MAEPYLGPQDPKSTKSPSLRRQLRSTVRAWQDDVDEAQTIKRRIEAVEAEMRQTDPGQADAQKLIELDDKKKALERDLEQTVRQREANRDRVIKIVGSTPRLKDEAIAWGFKAELFTEGPYAGSTDPDRQGEDDGLPGGKKDGKGDKGTGDGGPGTGDGGGGGPNNRWLPGVKGKDFNVVKYNGKTYVVYKVKHAGNFTMRVPDDKLKTYGINAGDGKQITKAQFQKLNHFGNASDILVHGENRHPFRQWIEQTEALYGGTGLLKNKEVMRVFLEGYSKGWSQEVIAGKLRQTKWFDSSTEYSRQWSMAMTTAEKKGQINSIGNQIKTGLQEIYGDNWLEYFPDWSQEQLDTWAKKIATGTLGATGSPTAAMDLFIRRQTRKAENIENTPAWIAKQQKLAQQGEFLGRPEDVRENLRQQAIQMLGYAGKDARIDGDTLTQWAERIAYSQLNAEGNPYTQADFDQYLRKQKQALFPYLDPDEAWQDAASTYKAKAEQLLDRTLSWNDRLLSDFAAKDETGKLTGTRLSDWDFERLARKDNRFWESKTATQEGYGLLAKLNETFNGSVL